MVVVWKPRTFLAATLVAVLPIAGHGQTEAPSATQSLPPGTNAHVEAAILQAYRLEQAGKLAEAEAGYRAALDLARQITDPREKAEFPRALLWMANFLFRQKRYEEAYAAGDRALPEYVVIFGANHPRTAKVHALLGAYANGARQFAGAEAHLRLALQEYARDLPKELQAEAANAALNLAIALRGQRRFADAQEAVKKAIEFHESSTPLDSAWVANAYLVLAINSVDLRRPGEATAAYAAAVRTAENLQGSERAVLATLLLAQAEHLRNQKNYPEAWLSADRARSLRESLLGKDHPGVGAAFWELGVIALARGDRALADTQFRLVVEIYDRRPTQENAAAAAMARFRLAESLRQDKRLVEAEQMIRASIALREAAQPVDLVSLAGSYQALAIICFDQRKIGEAESAARKAIDFSTRARGPTHLEVARLNLWFGRSMFEAGRYRDAEEPVRAAVDIFTNSANVLELTGAQVLLSAVYRYLHRFAEAEALVRQALELREKNTPPDSPYIADALFNLAAVLRWQHRYAEAEPLLRRSLAIREKLYGVDNRDVLADMNALALALDGMGRSVEAEPLFRRTLAGREKILGQIHEEVADTLMSLVWSLRRQGRFAEATEIAQRPLDVYRQALGPDHPFVIRGLILLAVIRQERAEFDEADRLFRDALRIKIATYGADSLNVAESYGDLVGLSAARRNFEEGVGYAAKLLSILEAKFGPDDPKIVPSMTIYANLQILTGELEAAERTLKRMLTITERTYAAESLPVAIALSNMAMIYRRQGKYGNAEQYYERPLAIYRKLLGPRHPGVAGALNWAADFRIGLGQAKDAEELYDEAISILAEAYGTDSPALSGHLNNKAILLRQLGRYEEAESLYRRAIELLRKGSGTETAALAQTLVNLGVLYEVTGRPSEATELVNQAIAIYIRIYGPDRLPPIVPAAILPPPPDNT